MHLRSAMQRWALYGTVVAMVLTAAACGGGGKNQKTASPSDAQSSTSLTTVSPQVDGPGVGTSSTVAVATSTTSPRNTAGTTVGSRAASTSSKKTSPTTSKAVSVGAGIINVSTTAATAPREDIQPGGTLTKLASNDFANLDPAYTSASSNDGPVFFALFDMLVYDTRDGTIVPQLAESITSTDGLNWSLKLRPGVRFTDGTALDAAAVKADWDRIADPTTASTQAAITANIASTSPSPDGLVLKVTLKAVDTQFPRSVVNISWIPSPTALAKMGKDAFAQNPVGAGPFRLKTWVRGSQMTLERNPSYWNPPRPYVDQYIFKFISDEQQRINAFKSGQGNLFLAGNPESADQIAKAGGQGVQLTRSGGFLLHFNLDKPPINDIRVRQAIYAAIDLKQFSQVIHQGLVPPVDSVFQQSSPLYDKTIVQPGYDPVRAQSLIDDYSKTVLGGKPVEIPITVINVQQYLDASQFIAGALNRLNNVKVTLDVQAITSVIQAVNTRNYVVATYGNAWTDPDPLWGRSFVSTAKPNPTGWKNAQFDADFADSKATLDVNRRIADFRDALKQFYTDLPSYYFDRAVYYLDGTSAVQDIDMTGNAVDLADRMWIKTH